MPMMYEILRPEHRWVNAEQLMAIASEIYIENEGFDGEIDAPTNVANALAIIKNGGRIWQLGRTNA